MEIEEKNIKAAYEATENEDVRNTIKALFPNVNFDRKVVINNFQDAKDVLGEDHPLCKCMFDYGGKRYFVSGEAWAFYQLQIVVAAYNKIHPERGVDVYRPNFVFNEEGKFELLCIFRCRIDEISASPSCLYLNNENDAEECGKKFIDYWERLYR
ncbi:MAG: hypothetical protein LUC44_06055 [Prevotellaceae bacterium]|nr:hypothetical protein [Prevotellaceae bacterium]